MKPTQRQLYAERIERAVCLLQDHGAESPPSVSDLASAAAMSEYHFHRVFRLMTGESVGAVMRRVRLARTLPDLQRQATVGRAMGASGYGSQQSFSRAFRATTGTTARAVRVDGAELDRIADMLRSRGTLDPVPLSIEIVSLEPFRLLAVRNVGGYAELNAGFHRVFELVLEQVPADDLHGIYGLPHDDPRFTPAEECRFDCALAVGSAGHAAGGLSEMRLGGGEWLRLDHRGDYDALHERIDELYAAALTTVDREIGSAPLFIHYFDDPEQVPEPKLRSAVYLPLA